MKNSFKVYKNSLQRFQKGHDIFVFKKKKKPDIYLLYKTKRVQKQLKKDFMFIVDKFSERFFSPVVKVLV